MQKTRSAALLLLACFGLMAQSERGNITGIVADPSGAAIASAELSIVNRDTNATAKVMSTSTGEYNAPNLQPGTYRIEIAPYNQCFFGKANPCPIGHNLCKPYGFIRIHRGACAAPQLPTQGAPERPPNTIAYASHD